MANMYIFGPDRLVKAVKEEALAIGLNIYECSVKEKDDFRTHRGFAVIIPDAKTFIWMIESAYTSNLDKVWFLGKNQKMKEVNTDSFGSKVLFKAIYGDTRPLISNPQYVYMIGSSKYVSGDL